MKSKIFDEPITEIKKGEKRYPKELLDLVDPPESLFVRGNFSSLNPADCLAVVGSRRVTRYGTEATQSLVTALVRSGITIVSGFMYGVDTIAHNATLSANGTTVAVLANGLNYVYPPENMILYENIVQSGGCLISEYTPEFKPQLWTYPKRNRIVAALSRRGTLVIEAAEKSGSLITASYADALNRPLFAVPGSIFSSTSQGTNQLIKDNLAKMVTSVEDIIPTFTSSDPIQPSLFDELSGVELKIIKELEEGLTLDEISQKLRLPVSEVSVSLSMLSLKSMIVEYGGKYTRKKHK